MVRKRSAESVRSDCSATVSAEDSRRACRAGCALSTDVSLLVKLGRYGEADHSAQRPVGEYDGQRLQMQYANGAVRKLDGQIVQATRANWVASPGNWRQVVIS